ncbi:cutinase precursor [Mycobacteroides abscessus subsp. abscessus]|nr:cutinase precursor [Mycobacteroides abscessus subsp. abscessus]
MHALYATPEFWQIDGNAATVWTTNWAEGLIENAPHPKHG